MVGGDVRASPVPPVQLRDRLRRGGERAAGPAHSVPSHAAPSGQNRAERDRARLPSIPRSRLARSRCSRCRRARMRRTEIARQPLVSPSTVKTHFSHIYEKLGLRTRAAAVRAGDATPRNRLAALPWPMRLKEMLVSAELTRAVASTASKPVFQSVVDLGLRAAGRERPSPPRPARLGKASVLRSLRCSSSPPSRCASSFRVDGSRQVGIDGFPVGVGCGGGRAGRSDGQAIGPGGREGHRRGH